MFKLRTIKSINCLANHRINQNVYLNTKLKGTKAGLIWELPGRQDHTAMDAKARVKPIRYWREPERCGGHGQVYKHSPQCAEGVKSAEDKSLSELWGTSERSRKKGSQTDNHAARLVRYINWTQSLADMISSKHWDSFIHSISVHWEPIMSQHIYVVDIQ